MGPTRNAIWLKIIMATDSFNYIETSINGTRLGQGEESLNRGVPLIEVQWYKDHMGINFAGTKVCVPLNNNNYKSNI